jgi:hypothetical protein
MGATTATKNLILNHYFGQQAESPLPGNTIYFGLSTTLVDETGITTVTEPTTGSYARVSKTNNDASFWGTSTANLLKNANATLVFPTATASWGTFLSLFIADASTVNGGAVLWYATLSPSIVAQNGTTITFAVNTIVISM